MTTVSRCVIGAVFAIGGGLIASAAGAAGFQGELMPPPMDRLYANRLTVHTPRHLSIDLFNVAVDHAKAKDAARFVVYSPDDPDFGEKGLPAVQSGGRTRTIKAPLRNHDLIKGTSLFLRLPRPMRSGKTYGVRVGDVGAAIPPLATVTFDDRRQVNDDIRVNQLGYVPGFPKRAYLGQYMGDLGPMPIEAGEFELLDQSGRGVFKGSVKPREVGDEMVGQTVYELDFTGFETPGTYRVFVAGMGVSYAFDIGPRALTPLYANLMNGHYHQRCGMAIEAPYSRHVRDACHLDDAFLDAATEKLKFVDPKNPPLYPTNYDGKRHAATHGHHDAGDFGKYVSTGATYVFGILNAMEAFPDKFREDRFGLPYSGNGIPDLVEEVKWELDWLENMQDESDGGVFGVIRPKNGGYEQYMPPREGGRLFFPKDTVFTAAYAGALAHAARSPVMRRHYPADCERYLAKALKAWAFLEKNERYVQYFHYGAIFGDWDERCWAAVELYGATGRAEFHKYFLEKFDPDRKRWDWWPLFEAVGYAAQAYLFMPADRPRDEAMLTRCDRALRAACDRYVEDAAAHPYRLAMPRDMAKSGKYGWIFPGDIAGYDLLMGYARTKDRRYLESALASQDYTCGANPSGYFLQTGLGAKRNIEVVNQQSLYDDIVEPVPGVPLGIGTPDFYFLSDYGKELGSGQYPDQWPVHNRWYDGFNVSSEVTMGPWARETIVAGFFGGANEPAAKGRTTVKIKANRVAGPAPLKVQFGIDVAGPAGEAARRVRQVFWDFDDETFSILGEPVHTFASPGRHYRVAVTVIDEDGIPAHDTVAVDCTLDRPKFAQEAAKPDDRTVALYHLDGDLKDASGHGFDLKARTGRPIERRPYRFAERPPMWMAKPTGSCLELDGAEQFAVEIGPDVLKEAVTLEMMIYLKEFAGWGYPGNPLLLGLQAESDAWVGWRQDTWEKSRWPKFGSAAGESVPAERFGKDFPRDRWCQVRVAYDGKGAASFYVDGERWGESRGAAFKNGGGKQPVVLTIGPFRGSVDDVRLSRGAN